MCKHGLYCNKSSILYVPISWILIPVILHREEIDKAQLKWAEELAQYEDEHVGNFRRIYPPVDGTEKYEKYFHSSGSLYQETAAFKARSEAARQVLLN